MKVRLDGTCLVGRALDLRGWPMTPDQVFAAIHDPGRTMVESPTPSPVHSHVGLVRDGMDLALREALVAAARSLGMEPPQSGEITRLTARIDAISPPDPDIEAARRRAAATGRSVSELRERVARLSGRVEAAREAGRDPSAAVEALRDATRELSEAETEAIAARQALSAAEARARDARDARADRLSLVDRRDNLRRRARSWLVEEVKPRFESALESLPVTGCEDGPVTDYPGKPHEAALAVARVARLRAPLVLVDTPFESPLRARAALDASVIVI